MNAILRVGRMNVTQNEKSLDALARKMTITAFFKAEINFGKIESLPTKTFFKNPS